MPAVATTPAIPAATPHSYTSFRDIADYGKITIEKYRAWAAKQNLNVLRSPPPGSKISRAERLDLVAGIIIQHLRQLYFTLENLGIALENRVQDSEWPSEYVLTSLW
jgi:hypothetical protein